MVYGGKKHGIISRRGDEMEKNLNILFMGTPDIAVTMLQQLLHDGYSIIGVVTQPDKKTGRKQIIQMSKVKEAALKHDLLIFQPIKIKDDYHFLMKMPIDLIVTCAYGQFIPQDLLEYPTYGSINVHASLLPKLRGGAPIHKAIMNGDEKTGISIMRMVKKMDAGDVMAQCSVRIGNRDTTGTLCEKLAIAGAELLSKSIPMILDGTAVFVKQQEEQATFAYTIQKEEEHIDFHRDVKDVYNHIRALLPIPAAHALMNGKKIKFHNVHMLEQQHAYKAGEIVGYEEQAFVIAARNGVILVNELQMEGKAKVDAKAFYNGLGKSLIGKIFT